ncbi:hypothetical protein AN641_09180 [Candidatus Epulonipiscioides gigas]|nr:hypothetical protein AN641_09180 [Epulopiscium sp. SCG-C07WGA-EpuloA2]
MKKIKIEKMVKEIIKNISNDYIVIKEKQEIKEANKEINKIVKRETYAKISFINKLLVIVVTLLVFLTIIAGEGIFLLFSIPTLIIGKMFKQDIKVKKLYEVEKNYKAKNDNSKDPNWWD